TRLLHGDKVRGGELGGGELSPPKAVARVRKRQSREVGHSSAASQENASAAPGPGFGRSFSGLPVPSIGGDRPSACKSSTVTPGGISLRAGKLAHHRRKKYSCCSQARHIGRLPVVHHGGHVLGNDAQGLDLLVARRVRPMMVE